MSLLLIRQQTAAMQQSCACMDDCLMECLRRFAWTFVECKYNDHLLLDVLIYMAISVEC